MIQMTFNFGSIEEARDHLARFTGQATPAVSSAAAVPVKAAIASGGPSLPSDDGAAPPVKRGPGRPKKQAEAAPAAEVDPPTPAPTPIEAAIDASKANDVVTHEQMADTLKKLVGGTTDEPDFSKPSAILAKYGYVRIKDVKEQHRGAIYADAVAAAAG